MGEKHTVIWSGLMSDHVVEAFITAKGTQNFLESFSGTWNVVKLCYCSSGFHSNKDESFVYLSVFTSAKFATALNHRQISFIYRWKAKLQEVQEALRHSLSATAERPGGGTWGHPAWCGSSGQSDLKQYYVHVFILSAVIKNVKFAQTDDQNGWNVKAYAK